MPQAFNTCVKNGGKVRTVKPNKDTYIHVCYLNGKSYRGEVKHIKKKTDYRRKIDRRMHDYGEIDERKKTIRVNPRKGDFLNTVIHEEMHRVYPDLSERQIRKKTARKESKMSVGQMINLLSKYKRGRKEIRKHYALRKKQGLD